MAADRKPNILFILTDQQRHDTIAALGNELIYTPNLDRLVRRGVAFTNAYSTCPVCMPARYTVRTGCEPPTTRSFSNIFVEPAPGQAATMRGRCGPYLAETMKGLGYRTFGIGKFHSSPWDEDLGYERHLHSEETYQTPEKRAGDAYARWIEEHHDSFSFLEMLMGERSEMYYMPQMSPLPAELCVEAWASDRAVEQINIEDDRPFFGVVSYIGPHPPLAPPIPFNRIYDPDRMPTPVKGDRAEDHMDDQIPWMNHAVFAEDVTDNHTRILYSRYYGEITYIDQCIGRVLDALEASGQADNTLVCFVSDHGDHMGDHHAWQKESFFESSCRIPFLLSWPGHIAEGSRSDALVCLTDLFGITTKAAGAGEFRDGVDVLGMLNGTTPPRESLVGYHGAPGTRRSKFMLRSGQWKYIFMANGGREQLFDLEADPDELHNLAGDNEPTQRMRDELTRLLKERGPAEALCDGKLLSLPFEMRERRRLYQFDGSRGVNGFPKSPEQYLREYSKK